MPFQKNFANLPSILLTHVNLVLLRCLIFPHLNFIPSLKLTYSTNHFLLSLFHALTSRLWLFWPGFRTSISHSFSLYHPRPFHSHALRSILLFTMSGNKPNKPPSIYFWLAFAGTLNLLTHFIVSPLMYILSLYISFISLSCEAVIMNIQVCLILLTLYWCICSLETT